ncbi:MAG: hypothetical protein QOE35_938 [Actinomycetota bacterium]
MSTSTTVTTAKAPAPRPASTAVRPRVTAAPRPAPSTEIVEVAYRVEVRTTDPAGADFASVVDATLHDDRGWQRARFRLVHRDDAEYVVMLAEPADAQELCKPYDVYSKYSCQNGPRVVVNAERWRDATPEWTGDLATYRQMVVMHEFGHLLGQHHPSSDCPVRGRPAAVMSQQSTELNGCLPNPWPLDWEITLAARHDQPLAPPYSR